MGSEERVCPVCGQPVETVVHRHKTLGAWVPVWLAGPCRNPDCAAYAEEGIEPDDERARRAAGKAAGKSAGQVGGGSAGTNS